MTAKICRKCKIEKDISCFSTASRNIGGKTHSCKTCQAAYRKFRRYDELRREQDDYKEYNHKRNKAYIATPKGRAHYLIIAAKKRAIEKNLPFNLTVEYVQVVIFIGICQRTGIKFDLETKGRAIRNAYAPSIDRIDSSKGYTIDNTQIVCDMYNHGKGQHSDEEFIKFCHIVAAKNPMRN